MSTNESNGREFRYPRGRKQFFAIYYIKTLSRYGMDDLDSFARWLCVEIAVAEDGNLYRGPVRFTNEILMERLRLRKETFLNARRQAVESGWLRYKRGRRHVPGEYFVDLPVRIRTTKRTGNRTTKRTPLYPGNNPGSESVKNTDSPPSRKTKKHRGVDPNTQETFELEAEE